MNKQALIDVYVEDIQVFGSSPLRFKEVKKHFGTAEVTRNGRFILQFYNADGSVTTISYNHKDKQAVTLLSSCGSSTIITGLDTRIETVQTTAVACEDATLFKSHRVCAHKINIDASSIELEYSTYTPSYEFAKGGWIESSLKTTRRLTVEYSPVALACS